MKNKDMIFWKFAATIFRKPRLAKIMKSYLPGMRFLLINAANYFFFLFRSQKSFVPSYIVMEVSNACNLKCPQCFRQMVDKEVNAQFMSLDFFSGFIERNGKYITHVQFGMWGEPLMNKHLPDMIELATRAKIKTILITNGTLLNKETIGKMGQAGLNTIQMSFDSINEEYEAIRGVNFSQALDRLRVALELKEKYSYHVEITTISALKRYSFDDFQRFFKEYSAHIDNIIIKPPYSDEKNKTFPFKRPCYRPWHIVGVYSDGIVTMCPFDINRLYIVGDATQDSLKKIFNSESIKLLRKQFSKGIVPQICRTCNPYYR